LGYVSQTCPKPDNVGCVHAGDTDRHRFGRVVAAALVETVVQHSAQTLMRALR
jgi:hypothetical protein